MAGNDPPYLAVGTDVSAKYRGAFCEAKVKKVVKTVKCKVLLKDTQTSVVVTDECIKGFLKHGVTVEVKIPDSGHYVEAIINKVTDCSMYTVVFDDGDEKTLRRTQLCLKGEKHFIESETLDNLPLSNPEHFGTPVMQNKKAKRMRTIAGCDDANSDSELSEVSVPKRAMYKGRNQELVGKVMMAELPDNKKKIVLSPVLVVLPDAVPMELRTKDYLLVRSFRDTKFVGVHRKELKNFSREIVVKNEDKAIKLALEKALLYFDNRELPANWDHNELLGTDSEDTTDEDDSSDDEPSEEKDRFVAQLYKFMDDRGTPINKGPCIGSRDLNLYKLFKIVQNIGGYNKVTNQMKWRLVYSKMALPPSNNPANQIKNAYKKFLHAFEDFYRKLGSTMGTISRPGRNRHNSGRSILAFRGRDKDTRPSPNKKIRDESGEKIKTKSDETKSEMESESDIDSIKEGISSKRDRILRKDILKEKEIDLKEVKDERKKIESMKDKKVEKKEETKDKKVEKDDSNLKEKKTDKIDAKDKKVELKDDQKEKRHDKKEDMKEKKNDKKDESKDNKVKKKEDIKEKKVEPKDKKTEKKEEDERKRPMRRDKDEDKRDLEEKKVNKKEEEKKQTNKKDDEKKMKSFLEPTSKCQLKSCADILRVVKKREQDEEEKDCQNKFGRRRSFRVEENRKDADKIQPIPVTEDEEDKSGKLDKDEKKVDEKKKKDEIKDNKIDKKDVKKSKLDNSTTKMTEGSNSDDDDDDDDDAAAEDDDGDCPVGTKLRVRYGKGKNLKIYEAKVMERGSDVNTDKFLVHYAGWNIRYDEWIKRDRIVSVVDKPESLKKVKVHSPKSPKAPGCSELQVPNLIQVITGNPNPNQSQILKKRGRPQTSTGLSPKPISETNSAASSPRPSSETRFISARNQSPGSAKKMKARPTRSNSMEFTVVEGLPPKRRPRKASGITDTSDQTSHVSESEESEQSDSDIDISDSKDVNDELDTTKEYDDELTVTDGELDRVPMHPSDAEIDFVPSELENSDNKCEVVKRADTMKSPIRTALEGHQETDERTKKQKPEDIPENDPYFPDFLLEEAEKSHVDVKLEKLEFLDRRLKREFDKKVKKDEFKWELDEMEGEQMSILSEAMNDKDDVKKDANDATVSTAIPEKTALNKQTEMVKPVVNEFENEIKTKDLQSFPELEQNKDEVTDVDKKLKLRKEKAKEQRKLFERRYSETEISKNKGAFDPPSKKFKEAESLTTYSHSVDFQFPAITGEPKDITVFNENSENDKKKVKKKIKKKENEIVYKMDMKSSAKKETGKVPKIRTGAKPGPKPKDSKTSQELQDSYSAVIDSVIKNTEHDGSQEQHRAADNKQKLECSSSQSVNDMDTVSQDQILNSTQCFKRSFQDPAVEVGSLGFDAVHSQEEQDPTSSTLMENTPPTTPEYSGGQVSPLQESQFLVSDETFNKDNNDIVTQVDSNQPSGGESPAGDVSPRSNESSVGSGNAACSEGSGDIPASLGKRRRDTDESILSKKKKKSGTRKGDKKLQNAGSDSDDACQYMKKSSPQQQHTSSQVLSSTVTSTSASSPRPSKYNFNLEEGKYLEGEERITFLINKIQEIRKIYMGLKAEVACIDRRRKRARRKEKMCGQNSQIQATSPSEVL